MISAAADIRPLPRIQSVPDEFHFPIGAVLRDTRNGSAGRVVARAEVEGASTAT
jgi:hypothetical protein